MNDKKQIRLRIGLTVVGIAAGIIAGLALWKIYQAGSLFDPSRISLNEQFQENPIQFSDQEQLEHTGRR